MPRMNRIMKSKEKPSETNNLPFLAILKGIIVGYAITFICFVSIALLLTHNEKFVISDSKMVLFIIMITILSVIFAGYIASRSAASKGWMWGGLTGVIYVIGIMIIGTLASDQLDIQRNLFTTFITCIASGTLGGMLGINKKPKKKYR